MLLATLVGLAAGPLACSAGDDDNRGNDSDTDAPGDGDSTDSDGDSDTDVTPARCQGTSAFLRIANAQALVGLIESSSRCMLYAADPTGTEVFYIDLDRDTVAKTVSVGVQPTDLALSSDGAVLYVAVLGEQKVVALDAETGDTIGTHPTARPPARITHGTERRVYYVEEEDFSAVHSINFLTDDEVQLTGVDYYEPDLESSADGTIVYVGESGRAPARLLKLDGQSPSLAVLDTYGFEGGFTIPSPLRRLTLAEKAERVYFADRAFSTEDLQRVKGLVGEQALTTTPSGAILASADNIYDGLTHVRIVARPHPGTGALFSSDGKWLYEFNALGSLLHRTSVATMVGLYRLGATNVAPGSLAQRKFNQFLADPVRPFLYAIDALENQLVFIDRTTLLPVRAEIIGSTPTDMSISPDGDEMAVATFGATEVAVLDLTASEKVLTRVIEVPGNPFRVALGLGGRLVYVEQDQRADVALLDFALGNVLDTLDGVLFQVDVEFDATGEILFAGESSGPNAKLYRYDLANDVFDEVAVSAAGYNYPARKVLFQSGRVYFAQRVFDATTLAELGQFDDDIVLVTKDGRWAVSRQRIYDAATQSPVGGMPADSGLIAADPTQPVLYQFDNDTGVLFVQPLPND